MVPLPQPPKSLDHRPVPSGLGCSLHFRFAAVWPLELLLRVAVMQNMGTGMYHVKKPSFLLSLHEFSCFAPFPSVCVFMVSVVLTACVGSNKTFYSILVVALGLWAPHTHLLIDTLPGSFDIVDVFLNTYETHTLNHS